MFPPLISSTLEGTYQFSRNDAYDKSAPVEMVIEPLLGSLEYMRSIREFSVPADGIAAWYMGQNGFLLKDAQGLLIGIDLYLTNSCATASPHLPFRLDRQLPVFVEPEDLEIDVFLTTHSHEDHTDPETIRRMRHSGTTFAGPFDSQRVYRACGVPEQSCRLIHPGERLPLSQTTSVTATFALPTDARDLNHMGILLEFSNGIRFYNTGDTAYMERLAELLPREVDICAICINGGSRNLGPMEAATIVKAIRPKVAIPSHYDMMVNNVGSPSMFRVALDLLQSDAQFVQMRYYEPWVYRGYLD